MAMNDTNAFERKSKGAAKRAPKFADAFEIKDTFEFERTLDLERASIFKRLAILKFLALLESVIVLYLAFVLSKDAIIALCAAVFVGVFFYRLLSRRLLARQRAIENELLQHFLAQNNAKFKGAGIDETTLQKLALPFSDIKTSAGVEFARFLLYDTSFKNASGGAFMGVLIVLKNAEFKADLPCIDENALFEKLNFAHFDTQRLFIKGEFALIATLQNPFFISPKLSLSQNLAQMNENLGKIESLIA